MFPVCETFPVYSQARWNTSSSLVIWHFVLKLCCSTYHIVFVMILFVSVSSTRLWAPQGQDKSCSSVYSQGPTTVPGPSRRSGNVWWMKVIWCWALWHHSWALMPQPCSMLLSITWCCYPPNHEKPPHCLPHRTSCFLHFPCPSLCSPEACGAVWVLSHQIPHQSHFHFHSVG